jgi:simple sugar transport system permease protein
MTQVSGDKEVASRGQLAGTGPTTPLAVGGQLERFSGPAQALSLLREASIVPVLILAIVVGAVVSPDFLKSANLWGLGQQASALAVTTAGEALILIVGSLDLSLGGTYGFAPMLAAWLVVPATAFGAGSRLNPYLGIVVLLLAGALIGLVNGLLIVKAGLNALIITLGILILLAGAQEGLDSGNTISALPTPLWYLGFSFWGPVPASLVVAVAVLLAVGLFLRYHPVGRAIFAIGGNADAARASGINIDRVKIGVFMVGGMLAALGGLMEMGRVQAITAAQGYGEAVIFMVFAAAVIGGVSLTGGKGNMVGVASGALLIGVVQNILDLKNVNSYWIEAVDGSVIVFALSVARVIGGKESQV